MEQINISAVTEICCKIDEGERIFDKGKQLFAYERKIWTTNIFYLIFYVYERQPLLTDLSTYRSTTERIAMKFGKHSYCNIGTR